MRLRWRVVARRSAVHPGYVTSPGTAGPNNAAGRSWGVLAALVAVVVVAGAGVVASAVIGGDSRGDSTNAPGGERDESSARPVVRHDAEGQPAAADGFLRAWPLTNDAPLPGGHPAEELRTPHAAARAYLTQVVGLPADWPFEYVQSNGGRATAVYALQGVRGDIRLVEDSHGYWYVTTANNEMISPGPPTGIASGLSVGIGPGPRIREGGVDVRVSAVAADGRILATATGRVLPPGQSAPNVTLEWEGRELVAVLRADALDDHDDDPSTAEATLGHWTWAPAGPDPHPELPDGADPYSEDPLFSAPGRPEDVAEAYLRDRFPDHAARGVEVGRAYSRGPRTHVAWRVVSEEAGLLAGGYVWLREVDGVWSVVAVTD